MERSSIYSDGLLKGGDKAKLEEAVNQLMAMAMVTSLAGKILDAPAGADRVRGAGDQGVLRVLKCEHQESMATDPIPSEFSCKTHMKAIYYPRGNLLDAVFGNEALPVWHGIEHGLELLKKASP